MFIVCDTTSPGSLHEARRHTRELVTIFLLVIVIRPQGEGKGIQAYMLVPITRLKPQVLDLNWAKDETDHCSRRGFSI